MCFYVSRKIDIKYEEFMSKFGHNIKQFLEKTDLLGTPSLNLNFIYRACVSGLVYF